MLINSSEKLHIEIMKYLRTVPGTVYIDQLKKKLRYEILEKSDSDAEYLKALNGYFRKEFSIDENDEDIININPHNSGVFTVPYMRKYYEHLLGDDYEYNRFLYTDSFTDELLKDADKKNDLPDCDITISENDCTAEMRIVMKKNECRSDGISVLENFSLSAFIREKLSSALDGRSCSGVKITELSFRGTVFRGLTDISFPDDMDIEFICTCEADFQNSTFENDLIVQNIPFFCLVKEEGCYNSFLFNFRNSRFFSDFTMRGVSFSGDSSIAELTFEDARFSGNAEIYDIDFGNAKLNCFQCVMGNYFKTENETNSEPHSEKKHSFILHNVNFSSDGSIDFSNSEFRNARVYFRNISFLPDTRMCFESVTAAGNNGSRYTFSPDIQLTVHECNINGSFFISNVSELSFYRTKNFGKIEEESGWAEIYFKGRPVKIKGMHVHSRITQAVYNNHYFSHLENQCKGMAEAAKCLDYVMLKENYLSSGMYDEEDNAFILYMRNKAYLDSYNRNRSRKCSDHKKKISADPFMHAVYNFLYIIGDFGISPVKVVFSLILSIFLFAGVFFSMIRFNTYDQFSIGDAFEQEIIASESETGQNTDDSTDSDTGQNCDNQETKHITVIKNSDMSVQVISSLIYSAGNIVPFSSDFAPLSVQATIAVMLENFYGAFLIGYFSVAVVRKSLR